MYNKQINREKDKILVNNPKGNRREIGYDKQDKFKREI